MPKMTTINKGKDKLLLTIDGKQIADIAIANSSHQVQVNLSVNAPKNVKITKVPVSD